MGIGALRRADGAVVLRAPWLGGELAPAAQKRVARVGSRLGRLLPRLARARASGLPRDADPPPGRAARATAARVRAVLLRGPGRCDPGGRTGGYRGWRDPGGADRLRGDPAAERPGLSREVERAFGLAEAPVVLVPERVPRLGGERAEVLAGRTDAELERAPELGEALIARRDVDRRRLDLLEACVAAERFELLERLEQLPLARRRGSEVARHLPEVAEERHLREIPRARRDDAAGPRDPPHLDEAGPRIIEEMQDELRERYVEGSVRPGQRLGCARAHVRVRNARAAGIDHRGRVDRGDVLLPDSARELLGQDSRAAADVEHA